ncbi:hypothetical protein [Spiroplasma endosymbiont of Nebria brevicollis]|uniref:hypothetical protein n=1 Tax=Spiroplasma endosymbiont of Nebria brevicollis TaxID=3066284 RepID=UPI00313A8D60
MRLILKLLGIIGLTSLPTMTIIDCTANVPTPPKPNPPTYNISIEKITKISFWPVVGHESDKAVRFEQYNAVNVNGVTDSTFWNTSFGSFFYGVISDNPTLVSQIEKKLNIKINKQIIDLSVNITNTSLLYFNQIYTHEIKEFLMN